MTRSRARSFSLAATASSRSRNTSSASSVAALARKRSLEPGTAWQERRDRGIEPRTLATLPGSVRTILLATLLLLVVAPAARAATTVTIDVGPTAEYGNRTTVTGTVKVDGLPAPGRPVELLGRTHP